MNVMNAFVSAGNKPVTLVLSDHVGHDHMHGANCPEDMTIPWILAGPGVREGVELATPVYLYDTSPTLAAHMGIKRPTEGQVRLSMRL